MITYTIPIKTVSESNMREFWAVKAKRARTQRNTARIHSCVAFSRFPMCKRSMSHLLTRCKVTLEITLTRIGKRKQDRDNMIGGMKHVIDGIADALEIDDGDERLDWQYKQEIGKTYGVRVEIKAKQ
jgi:hypothetical protein